jgi:hypothetical protein
MAMRPARLSRSLGLCVVSATAFLSACGSGSPAAAGNGEAAKSATTIFADAEHATASASSVHIVGRITTGSTKEAFDFVDAAPRSGGTITDNGATFTLILAGKTIYLKGDATSLGTLSGNQAAGQLLGGKWLQASSSDKDLSGLSQLFDLPSLVQAIKPKGALRKGSVTTVDGRSAIALTDTSRSATLYVATTDHPYMLEITGGPKEPGTVTFGQYTTARPPAVPTGAVNLDQLENG